MEEGVIQRTGKRFTSPADYEKDRQSDIRIQRLYRNKLARVLIQSREEVVLTEDTHADDMLEGLRVNKGLSKAIDEVSRDLETRSVFAHNILSNIRKGKPISVAGLVANQVTFEKADAEILSVERFAMLSIKRHDIEPLFPDRPNTYLDEVEPELYAPVFCSFIQERKGVKQRVREAQAKVRWAKIRHSLNTTFREERLKVRRKQAWDRTLDQLLVVLLMHFGPYEIQEDNAIFKLECYRSCNRVDAARKALAQMHEYHWTNTQLKTYEKQVASLTSRLVTLETQQKAIKEVKTKKGKQEEKIKFLFPPPGFCCKNCASKEKEMRKVQVENKQLKVEITGFRNRLHSERMRNKQLEENNTASEGAISRLKRMAFYSKDEIDKRLNEIKEGIKKPVDSRLSKSEEEMLRWENQVLADNSKALWAKEIEREKLRTRKCVALANSKCSILQKQLDEEKEISNELRKQNEFYINWCVKDNYSSFGGFQDKIALIEQEWDHKTIIGQLKDFLFELKSKCTILDGLCRFFGMWSVWDDDMHFVRKDDPKAFEVWDYNPARTREKIENKFGKHLEDVVKNVRWERESKDKSWFFKNA